jgi:basic amino acid/polyamine antiporter, APA family
MAPDSLGRGSFLQLTFARLRARALKKPPLSLYSKKQSVGASSLKKVLTAWDLTFMGIGGIIGAGVFVLTGTAARDEAG